MTDTMTESHSFNPAVSGRDLLVHPVTEEGARGVTAYLPGKGEVSLSQELS
jgi:hypothetical protein